MLRDALGVRFGEIGAYRSFGIQEENDRGLLFAARERVAMYAKVVAIVARNGWDYEMAAARARSEWGKTTVRSQDIEVARFAEYYHFCMRLLESDQQPGQASAPATPTATQPPKSPSPAPPVIPPWRQDAPRAAQSPAAPKPAEPAPVPTAPIVNVMIDTDKIAAAIDRLAQVKMAPPAAAEEKDSGGWTASRAEMAVEQYLKARKPLYMELLPRCLASEKAALVRFGEIFGPKAIAETIGCGLLRGTVGKTPTYVSMLQPVLNGKQPIGTDLAQGDDGTLNDILTNMRRQAGGE